ncbi:hypothetical protein [Flavobacterium sp.]|uniref:hypothetical protein n=1 Tax=Flavobacterium sp. TaxID=239 RepID=UPI002635A4C0|nr:hypothetical protein [Flavobacterium sp.]
MTAAQFEKLSNDLSLLASKMPLHWGFIQNNATDSQVNMFQIADYETLERQITALTDESKNYFRRRWFLWKCAQCDEYLFCQNSNVTPNPNHKDQSYDLEFNSNSSLRFDLKGTVIPKDFIESIDKVVNDPTEMVRFFYEKQSTGVRSNIQNRLFIAHHSMLDKKREMHLRSAWEFKKNVFAEYASKVSIHNNFISCQKVISDVIFILEDRSGNLSHKFYSID